MVDFQLHMDRADSLDYSAKAKQIIQKSNKLKICLHRKISQKLPLLSNHSPLLKGLEDSAKI